MSAQKMRDKLDLNTLEERRELSVIKFAKETRDLTTSLLTDSPVGTRDVHVSITVD